MLIMHELNNLNVESQDMLGKEELQQLSQTTAHANMVEPTALSTGMSPANFS